MKGTDPEALASPELEWKASGYFFMPLCWWSRTPCPENSTGECRSFCLSSYPCEVKYVIFSDTSLWKEKSLFWFLSYLEENSTRKTFWPPTQPKKFWWKWTHAPNKWHIIQIQKQRWWMAGTKLTCTKLLWSLVGLGCFETQLVSRLIWIQQQTACHFASSACSSAIEGEDSCLRNGSAFLLVKHATGRYGK